MKGYFVKWVFFLIFLIASRMFFFEIYEVSQNSMENTLRNGAWVGIQKALYKINHGDIIVFKIGNKNMIKRCIGLPGDTLRILNAATIVNGSLLAPPTTAIVHAANHHADLVALSAIYDTYGKNWDFENFGPYIIPRKNMTIPLTETKWFMYQQIIEQEIYPQPIAELKISYTFKNDYYFLVGDNRHQSEDSRMFGPISKPQIIGKVIVDFQKLI